jgi:hypothetical protein
MKVSLRLRRHAESAPATALFLPTQDVGELLSVCSRLGHDALPPVHFVAQGFLVKLPGPTQRKHAGAIALRALARDLFIPTDAELIPPLLDDEAGGLVRDRALLLLPGAGASAFAPHQPVTVTQLIRGPEIVRKPWRSLPNVRPLADRLTSVTVHVPEEPPEQIVEQIVEQGREEIGTEAPLDSSASLPARALGQTALGQTALGQTALGQTALGLGRWLSRRRVSIYILLAMLLGLGAALLAGAFSSSPGGGMGGLGFLLGLACVVLAIWLAGLIHRGALDRLGTRLAAAGMALAPRITEEILGKQEAALRYLLDLFHAGKIEEALRRALVLDREWERGDQWSTQAALPTNDLNYSLRDVLAKQRPGGAWVPREEITRQLRQEYRKQAEEAARRGDYRRAAYIYAKLLSDYRQAAVVLARGGLHHDAALIYQKKLNDNLAAAHEFEAGGEFDDAVKLYREAGAYLPAGDLLMRMGEEEPALAEYRAEANRLVATQGYYQAGELWYQRIKRPDLALEYYEHGWQQRPHNNALPCALRLSGLYACQEALPQFFSLLGQAEEYLRTDTPDGPAAEFFNEVVRLADRPSLASHREDVRDRAFMGIASRLRARVRQGTAPANLVSSFLGQSNLWPAAVVSDAQFACDTGRKRREAPAPTSVTLSALRIPARIPVVTAVAWAEEAGDLFVGFESGEVVCYRTGTGEMIELPLARENDPVLSLAVTAGGTMAIVARATSSEKVKLTSVHKNGRGFHWGQTIILEPSGPCWLCPIIPPSFGHCAYFWDGEQLRALQGKHYLIPERTRYPNDKSPVAMFPYPRPSGTVAAFVIEDQRITHYASGFAQDTVETTDMAHMAARALGLLVGSEQTLGWTPGLPEDSSLAAPQVSWLKKGSDSVELVGMSSSGMLYWSKLVLEHHELVNVVTRYQAEPTPYLAATLIRPGFVAAVTSTHLHTFHCDQRGLGSETVMSASMADAIACYYYADQHCLMVVCRGGTIKRVALAR